jgi:peroxiredoxin
LPRAGRPGEPLPTGWDEPRRARLHAPELRLRDERAAIAAQGARVLGLSAQPLEELRELTERLVLPYPLLNDPELRLAAALVMPRLAGFAARSTSA